MHHFLRRTGALTLAATVGVSLALTAPGAASAAVDSDAAPVAGAATWLESQLTDGVVVNPNFGGFDDLGLSIDVALGLDAVGGHDPAVQEITDAIAANLASYTSYEATPGGNKQTYAGSLGKALALATSTGRDGRDFGGTDLVADLEAQIATVAPIDGRIQDAFDPVQPDDRDYSNTIGQAFAVQGLDAEDSALVEPATDFLLAQQCSGGFFRLGFADADAAEQSCDDAAEPAPDTDVTALAVIALQSQADDTDVRAALTRATDWLAEVQRTDGAFGGGTATEAPNANSTGLAATALGLSGSTAAAAKAAAWIAARQVTALPCSTSAAGSETGAIAYDEAAGSTADSEGITIETSDQFRRATAQALPGLLWLDDAPTTSPLTLSGPAGFRAARSSVRVAVAGLRDGEQACIGGTVVAGPSKSAIVKLPSGTATRTLRAVRLGAPSTSVSIKVLGAKKLPVKLKRAKVKRRGGQVVRVAGLAPRERVRVYLRGKRVDSGVANSRGVVVARFKVTGKLGKARVKVVGQFANRTNTKTIRVTR